LVIVKKNCAPLRKLFAPLVSQAGYGLSFCLRPLRSCRDSEQCTSWTPSHSPWVSNPNSELGVKPYRDTPIVSFFSNIHTLFTHYTGAVCTDSA